MSYPDPANIAAAESAIERIRTACPNLQMDYADTGKAPVDWFFEIPSQPGLSVPVYINLQDDELHLVISAFWCEWFPCTNPDSAGEFVQAVVGFLCGEIRLRETLRGGVPVKSELQRLDGSSWKTIASWRTLHLRWISRKSVRVIHNEPA